MSEFMPSKKECFLCHSKNTELTRLRAELEEAREVIKFYNGLRIEVIRECGGGMCEVPHRVNLFDKARAFLERAKGEGENG